MFSSMGSLCYYAQQGGILLGLCMYGDLNLCFKIQVRRRQQCTTQKRLYIQISTPIGWQLPDLPPKTSFSSSRLKYPCADHLFLDKP